MDKNQGIGISERVAYGVVSWFVIRFGSKLGLTIDDVAWLTGGALVLIGGVTAWIKDRPVATINRAAESLPENTKLIMATSPDATHADKVAVQQLGLATNGKVLAKTTS